MTTAEAGGGKRTAEWTAVAPGGFDQGRREVYEAEPVALISGDRRRLGGDQRARHPGRGSNHGFRLAKCRHRPGSWAGHPARLALAPRVFLSLFFFCLWRRRLIGWLPLEMLMNPDLRMLV